MSEYRLEMHDVVKTFPGVKALDGAQLKLRPGTVHALMGENGAGKSTLMKCMFGIYHMDEGEVLYEGEKVQIKGPLDALNKGIAMVHQELQPIPERSIGENIYVGRYPTKKVGPLTLIDHEKMYEDAAKVLEEVHLNFEPKAKLGSLSVSQMQLVEIAKAISKNCKVLIMDEPSAAIAVAEVENMFRIIRQLKKQGVTIIYISHRMDEVFEISDRVSILRDGRFVATRKIGEVSRQDLINMMVGRELTESFPGRNVKPGEVVFEVKHLSGNGDFDINFHLRKGEILGLAGLVGAGRTELAKMLFGDVKPTSGEIIVKGNVVKFSDTSKAIEAGIGLIPEDRKKEGAFLGYSIQWNIPCMSLKRISRAFVIDKKEANRLADEYVEKLRIKTPTVKQLVRNLSGGNQQKVVVAKVLAAHTDILIFDEPTRGIDVGAKQEIYHLMNELVEQGMSIIMISSEMEELLGMSDRVMVLYEGRISGELSKEEFSQSRVLELASGL